MSQEAIILYESQGEKDKRGRTIDMMKCKFYLKSPDGGNNRCLNPSCRLIKCRFTDPQNECECFEPERIEYGSSDAYNDEDEFYKKYCRGCSSLVCSGVRDTVAREGCRYYRHEMKKETSDNLHLAEGAKIAFPKYSARISIGNFQINLTDKTFTEEQIKNIKEMLGWEVENL